MATTFGFTSSDVIPQPGFSATRNANNGWDGEHSFKVLRSFWSGLLNRASFDKGVSITTLDSSIPSFWFLYIDRIQVTNEECEWVDVKTLLAGSSSLTYENEEANEPTYSLNGQLQEVSLSTHPKYTALAAVEQNSLGLLLNGQAQWAYSDIDLAYKLFWPRDGTQFFQIPSSEQLTTDDAKSFAAIIARGDTTYLKPSFTWLEMAEGTDAIPSTQLNKLGHIATPKGDPPTPSGGRNWLMTSATQEETAGTYRTSIEWTLSERLGFDSFLYDD